MPVNLASWGSWLALASMTTLAAGAVGCSRTAGKGAASAPAATGASHLAVEIPNVPKVDVRGGAFAQIDPSTKELHVYVYSADASPRPTCDANATLGAMSKGAAAAVVASDFAGAPGTFPITEGIAVSIDAAKGDASMGQNPIDRAALHVTSVDAKTHTLTAEIVPAASRPASGDAAGHASGAVTATLCADLPASSGAVAARPAPIHEDQPPGTSALVIDDAVCFAPNAVKLRGDAASTLGSIADEVKKRGPSEQARRVVVLGRAGAKDRSADAQSLSEARARKVAAELQARGLDGALLATHGLGVHVAFLRPESEADMPPAPPTLAAPPPPPPPPPPGAADAPPAPEATMQAAPSNPPPAPSPCVDVLVFYRDDGSPGAVSVSDLAPPPPPAKHRLGRR